MQIHHLKKSFSRKTSRRVGRGGKRGTFSGRGTKGLGARAGGKFRPEERDIIKRIPKLRGYRFRQFRVRPATVNMAEVEKKFKAGALVNPETLLKAGLIDKKKGRIPKVKILGRGNFTKRLTFRDVLFSKAVAEKLKVDVIPAKAGSQTNNELDSRSSRE